MKATPNMIYDFIYIIIKFSLKSELTKIRYNIKTILLSLISLMYIQNSFSFSLNLSKRNDYWNHFFENEEHSQEIVNREFKSQIDLMRNKDTCGIFSKTFEIDSKLTPILYNIKNKKEISQNEAQIIQDQLLRSYIEGGQTHPLTRYKNNLLMNNSFISNLNSVEINLLRLKKCSVRKYFVFTKALIISHHVKAMRNEDYLLFKSKISEQFKLGYIFENNLYELNALILIKELLLEKNEATSSETEAKLMKLKSNTLRLAIDIENIRKKKQFILNYYSHWIERSCKYKNNILNCDFKDEDFKNDFILAFKELRESAELLYQNNLNQITES